MKILLMINPEDQVYGASQPNTPWITISDNLADMMQDVANRLEMPLTVTSTTYTLGETK